MRHQNVRDASADRQRQWRGLTALCLGVLIVVMDSTVVSVALPYIREELYFTETSLVWVVNSYVVAYGGFLLLSGRLGDLYGHRKLFLIGVAVFTTASLACGLANTRTLLVLARAAQGLGGAIVVAGALSLIAVMFTGAVERAKAMGVYGFVCAGGGAIGLLLGGLLTEAFTWRWIFLVNVPIGLVVFVLCRSLLPAIREIPTGGQIDIWGAITLGGSLTLAVYFLISANDSRWPSVARIELLTCITLLLGAFLLIEARTPHPLMPLRVFTVHNLAIANIVGALVAAGGTAWFFISALYMQLVLGYEPLQIGLSFLPASIITAALTLGISARLVTHFGIKKPLSIGILLMALGFALLACARTDGKPETTIFAAMTLLGLGDGIACNPLLLAALSDIAQTESGLASGLTSTTSMIGSALGLAILANLAAARTNELLAAGYSNAMALTAGFRAAFLAAAILVGMAGIIALVFLRTRAQAPGSDRARILMRDPQ